MKSIFSTLAACFITSLSFGQSWIDFSNDANSPVYTNALAFGGSRGLMAQPNVYYFGLFLAPAGVTDPNLFTFTGAYATNTPIAGHFAGGNVQVSGWPEGVTATLQVRGWSANLGHDWTAIVGQESTGHWAGFGYYGQSAMVQFSYPGVPTPPSRAPFGSFDLLAVPEPSIAALVCAGLLVLARRRK